MKRSWHAPNQPLHADELLRGAAAPLSRVTGLRDSEGLLDIELRVWPVDYIRARARAIDVRPYDTE